MQKQEIIFLPKSISEAKSIGHNLYFTGVACKYGHTTYRYVKDRVCSDCAKAKVKRLATCGGGNARRWANKTPEQLAAIYAKRKDYYDKTRLDRQEEKRRSHHKRMQDPAYVTARNAKAAIYRKENGRPPERNNPEVKRKYRQTEKGHAKILAHDAKRRAAKMQRTPAWLTDDDFWMMEQAYELAVLRTKMFGFSWHVDHIIPMQGKYISGLHVPYNLQVIPGAENISKANKYLPA